VPTNQWERLLTAGLARDFEQLRIRVPGTRARQGSGRRGGRVDRTAAGADRAIPAACRQERARKATSVHQCSPKSRARRASSSLAKTRPAVLSAARGVGKYHWRIADVRFGGCATLKRGSIDFGDKRVDRARFFPSRGVQCPPENRLEADRGRMAAIRTERLTGGA